MMTLRFSLLALLPLCAACAQLPSVGDRPVPNAFFVFFDKGSAQSAKGSDPVLREAAAFLRAHDDIRVNVVGHRSSGETARGIDLARADAVGAALEKTGIGSDRMVVVGRGQTESVASAAGGDPTVDRRVDIVPVLLGTAPLR